MNSDYMAQNSLSKNNDILYGAHTVTLLSNSVSYENNTGKFIINYATPSLNDSKAYDVKMAKTSSNNIINKNSNLGTTNITKSNYVDLHIPRYLFFITDISVSSDHHVTIYRKEYFKGTKFIVVNAGGQINSPIIIGVDE